MGKCKKAPPIYLPDSPVPSPSGVEAPVFGVSADFGAENRRQKNKN